MQRAWPARRYFYVEAHITFCKATGNRQRHLVTIVLLLAAMVLLKEIPLAPLTRDCRPADPQFINRPVLRGEFPSLNRTEAQSPICKPRRRTRSRIEWFCRNRATKDLPRDLDTPPWEKRAVRIPITDPARLVWAADREALNRRTCRNWTGTLCPPPGPTWWTPPSERTPITSSAERPKPNLVFCGLWGGKLPRWPTFRPRKSFKCSPRTTSSSLWRAKTRKRWWLTRPRVCPSLSASTLRPSSAWRYHSWWSSSSRLSPSFSCGCESRVWIRWRRRSRRRRRRLLKKRVTTRWIDESSEVIFIHAYIPT